MEPLRDRLDVKTGVKTPRSWCSVEQLLGEFVRCAVREMAAVILGDIDLGMTEGLL